MMMVKLVEKNESRIKLIRERLQTLSPTELNIIDESHKHIGHEGAKIGLGHFYIEIQSDAFNGKTKLVCHRLIYAALGDLMQTDVHAVRIKVLDSNA